MLSTAINAIKHSYVYTHVFSTLLQGHRINRVTIPFYNGTCTWLQSKTKENLQHFYWYIQVKASTKIDPLCVWTVLLIHLIKPFAYTSFKLSRSPILWKTLCLKRDAPTNKRRSTRVMCCFTPEQHHAKQILRPLPLSYQKKNWLSSSSGMTATIKCNLWRKPEYNSKVSVIPKEGLAGWCQFGVTTIKSVRSVSAWRNSLIQDQWEVVVHFYCSAANRDWYELRRTTSTLYYHIFHLFLR